MKQKKKVISFSLWGSEPKYINGAIENAKLTKTVYPGWIARFYVGSEISQEIINKLMSEDAEVFIMTEPSCWTSTFWRFYAVQDPEVSVMISRDTDSRLGAREKEAVDQWLNSSYMFHIMRDHPAHATEILAGMWGAKEPIFSIIDYALKTLPRVQNTKQADQIFLRQIYQQVYQHSLVHDPYFQKKPFPSKRIGADFVGQVYENDGKPCQLFADDLMKDERTRET